MEPIAFIDAHVHADNRSGEDFDRLAVAGCAGLVAVAGALGGYRSAESLQDHFRRLARVDRNRVETAGIRFHLALGIHPAGIPESGPEQALATLPGALRDHGADAVGEIGLDRGGDLEEHVFTAQMAIAAEHDLPVVVHTPRRDKARIADREIRILNESDVSPERILLDHVNEEILAPALEAGTWVGLSVHPAKLRPADIARIVDAHGPGRFVISTDMGAARSHLFGIPAAISAMQARGLSGDVIRAVVHDHAVEFLDVTT